MRTAREIREQGIETMYKRKDKREKMGRFREVAIKPTFQRYLDIGYEDVVDFKEYIRLCGKQAIKQANEGGGK